MTKPKEFWVFKGESNFYSKKEYKYESNEEVRCTPEGFYDIVALEDTVDGAVHVIEYSALEALQAKLEVAIEALKTIKLGFGPYSQDYHKHAVNCIEAMKNVADEALEDIEEVKE